MTVDPLPVSRTWPDRAASVVRWSPGGNTFASAIRTTITLTGGDDEKEITAPGEVFALAFDPAEARLVAAPYSFELPAGTLTTDATDALTDGLPPEAARGFELIAAAAAPDGAIVLAGRYRPPRGLPPKSGWSGPSTRIVLHSDDGPTVLWEGVGGDFTVACGTSVVAFADTTVRVVGREDGSDLAELGTGPAVARVLAFDAAQERLAAGFADGSVLVYSIADGTLAAQWQAQASDVWALAWSGDRLVTGGGDGSVRLFGPDGSAIASAEPQEHRPITALAVHPDGDRVLVAAGGPYPELVEIDLTGL